MQTFVALLRAVNVGGGSPLRMADFSGVLTALGCARPRTLLQSGNAIFEARAEGGTTLADRIQQALRTRLGLTTEVLIRTAGEWRGLIAKNPFPEEAKLDPSHLLVVVLRDSPSPTSWKTLRSTIVGRERIEGTSREAYLYYREGVGKSKLTAAVIERHLQTVGTSRNWNTVLRIEAACQPPV